MSFIEELHSVYERQSTHKPALAYTLLLPREETAPAAPSSAAARAAAPLDTQHSQQARHSKVAVLLHPYARLGGSRYDPVVVRLQRELARRGWAAIAFDVRGAGDSAGSGSFSTTTEQDDLVDVIRDLALPLFSSPSAQQGRLAVIGYSYGALISSTFHASTLSSLLERSTPQGGNSSLSFSARPTLRTVLISYPLSVRPLLSLWHAPALAGKLGTRIEEARRGQGSILALHGGRDQFTGKISYETWAQSVLFASDERQRGDPTGQGGNVHHSASDERVKVVLLDESDHFWRGESLARLARTVLEWLELQR